MDINPVRPFPKEEELYNRVMDLLTEYEGEISIPAAIGVLHLLINDIAKED